MDKTAIKNFAIEARKILMKSAITEAGFYGITKDGCQAPVQKGNDFEVYETVAGTENRIFGDDIKRRANLVAAIKEQGFDQVIEETAYTWFNRIIAIRFMEVNNYLPTRVRVLSSETGSTTPDVVTQSDTVELNLSSDELEKIQTAKRENRYDDAFRSLFIKQCNELNAILPGLFEKTDDYMELLLKITYTGDGVIRMLVDSIPEDNFNVETEGQVEIIGWMYQYYNTELKDDTFAKLKKNVKITKERIPAATQLFTPDWIVRYMVENSLGRVWIEHLRAMDPSVDEKAKAEEFGWKYYLPEAEQEDNVQTQLVEIRKSYKDLTPQDITCIDPCMGSGHILVYMFDVLMDIYRSEGFSEREAVFDVLEKNIRGLDIDRRAYQLSYFALMMKARGYNRIFFRGHEDIDGNRVHVVPRVYVIEDSNSIDRTVLHYYGAGMLDLEKNNADNQMRGFLDQLHDAKEYGSFLKIDNYDWDLLRRFVGKTEADGQLSIANYAAEQTTSILIKLIEIGEIFTHKYDVVITNPPYMGATGMNVKVTNYVKKQYPDSKSDLFAVFIEKCMTMMKQNAFTAMITQTVWLFITTYEKLRDKVLLREISSLIQIGYNTFPEMNSKLAVACAFVLQNKKTPGYVSTYYDLDRNFSRSADKEQVFKECIYNEKFYLVDNAIFDNIPGKSIAYWLSDNEINAFEGTHVGDYADTKTGMATTDNTRFLRLWSEVDWEKVCINCESIEDAALSTQKWFPYNKGGGYRKWYGLYDYVVNWECDGKEIRKAAEGAPGGRLVNIDMAFKESLTWSAIAIDNFSIRYSQNGAMFDAGGPSCFVHNKENIFYLLGYLNSNVAVNFLNAINPTINYKAGTISNIPFIVNKDYLSEITETVKTIVSLSKDDWDSFENSWNYKTHPFITARNSAQLCGDSSVKIETCYGIWEQQCNSRFNEVKGKEEKLNKLFIDIYGLQDELDSAVEEKAITVRKADLSRDIRSLISFAVGCMFGRYSLDEEGLVYAGGLFDKNRYQSFKADEDAVIPITDESYFSDDIVARFEDFLKSAFGQGSIEENLEFVAKVLGNKGANSREIIRNYFLNDFYKDHATTYSVTGSGKRPIYWLFDSGKQNGFKCLIYLHRYTPDTIGMIRSDYLTKTQSMIENALKNAEYAINTSSSAVDRAQATKKRDKYIKQLAEIRAYYPALSHIALQRIELDLDDGVKANYAKFQGIEVSVEGEKKQKVDLLAKI